MDYNIQHKQIERICKKYWSIDQHLGGVLTEKPKFTYQRAPTLRDLISKNLLDPPAQMKCSFFEGKGYYPCKKIYILADTLKKVKMRN